VLGFALLAIWIAALQIMLDKGQDAGWFGAVWIRWLAGLAAVGFLAFVAWELTTATPLINLRILKNRNFASCTAVMILVAMILYSTTALLPMFLQTLMGYPALQSGLAVSPRGLGSVVGVLIAGRWMSRVDERFFMAAALVALAWSSYLLGSINLNIGMFSVTWPIIINGFAVSMLFIPLTTVSVSTLRQDQIGNATSIYNLVRNLGGAIGISVTTALLSQISQARQSLLVRHATALNPAWRRSVQRLQTVLAPHGPAATMRRDAFAILYHQISQQVNTLAFIDDFRLLALLALACLPLVLMLRPPRHHHLAL
jgi:DHA2 family multidrug resistance protein